MLTGPRFARVSYVLFTIAVLMALLKLSGISGAKPFFLRIAPVTPVAKAAEPTAREESGGELLVLPEVPRRLQSGFAELSDEEEDDTPVFYRPSSGPARRVSGEPVCGDLGGFPKSSRAIFPLPEAYFGSYEDTWGAPRPQGGHEGTDLMSPVGTPEFAITDGTIVPVSRANENGWNRLGGYTVMLEAAYDIGPIKEGDLFYYAHMDQESVLPMGTKVRAGQQIGVAGDTGEGSEVTRGKFPSHLHLGWYDTSPANNRTNLKSGAMNPYPLLLWLEENGGAVSGGTDAAYCEAPQKADSAPSTDDDYWPAPENPGISLDLDTGSAYDARPSPAIGENQRRYERSPERESEPNEKNGSSVLDERVGTTGRSSNAVPTGGSEKNDGTRNDPGRISTSSEDQASRPTAVGTSSGAKIWEKSRSFLLDPRSGWASRPYYASIFADMFRKKTAKYRNEKNAGKKDRNGEERGKDRGGRHADEQEKKEQKKSPNPLEGKEPGASRSDRPKSTGGEGTAPVTDAAGKEQPTTLEKPENRSLHGTRTIEKD